MTNLDPLDLALLPELDSSDFDFVAQQPAQKHPTGTPRPPKRYIYVDKTLVLEPLFRAGGIASTGQPWRYTETETGYIAINADVGICLDESDQTILYAVLELLKTRLTPHAALPTEAAWKEAFAANPLQKLKIRKGYGAISTTFKEICQSADLAVSGNNNKLIMRSLRKLGAVQFVVYEGKSQYPIQLLDWYRHDNSILIGIHPEISYSALVHTRSVRYSMSERALLKRSLSKWLHSYLVGRLHDGHTFRNGVYLDTIVTQVYREPSDRDPLRKWRDNIKKALIEIRDTLGWQIEFGGRGAEAKAYITRPASRREPKKTQRGEPYVDLEKGVYS